MVGRGLRICPETGKEYCLVLDYGGNIKRLGFIDDPLIYTDTKKTTKECPNCAAHNSIKAKECLLCGEQFPGLAAPKEPIKAGVDWTKEHDTGAIISWDADQWIIPPHEVNIEDIDFTHWVKKGSPIPSIRVKYYTATKDIHFCEREYSQWIFPQHTKHLSLIHI